MLGSAMLCCFSMYGHGCIVPCRVDACVGFGNAGVRSVAWDVGECRWEGSGVGC
ncbi:hypothetical protein KC19_8G138600 [Ceratodon purpureus]|uniref:Uncharacterized protein n=1 Tax=Ceratodon purpureus TaxID=3225 RepID=A0A8T0H0C9_CERPU|nr:hypothetical protein KC19_8G138600 [Ceratodon purpureus]